MLRDKGSREPRGGGGEGPAIASADIEMPGRRLTELETQPRWDWVPPIAESRSRPYDQNSPRPMIHQALDAHGAPSSEAVLEVVFCVQSGELWLPLAPDQHTRRQRPWLVDVTPAQGRRDGVKPGRVS